MKKNSNTHKLAVCAIMVALGAVLSLIKVLKMPFGGSVTLLSMLPCAMVSVMFGLKWGLAASFTESVIQLAFGITMDGVLGWGLTPACLIGTILLDYIAAYTVIGLAGVLRSKGYIGMCLGTGLAVLLRFVCHLLSGAIIFANFEEFVAFGASWVGHPWFYSLCYNGAYMLPEMIFTVVAAAILFKLPQIKKIIAGETV
ncbi:MAG: energy-coupled thiamine transporter ThiT [Hominenteromicrobium sp.]